jgi:pyruvate dehydrogenase (quinone)
MHPHLFSLGTVLFHPCARRLPEVAAFAAGAEAILQGRLRSAQAVAARAIFTSSMASLIVIGIAYRYWRLRRRSRVMRSEAATFRRRILSIYSKDCSYYCELVSQPEQMPRVLGIAMRTALTKRGVAVVVIPGDVALRECSAPALSLGITESVSFLFPSDNELRNAAVNSAMPLKFLTTPARSPFLAAQVARALTGN